MLCSSFGCKAVGLVGGMEKTGEGDALQGLPAGRVWRKIDDLL
ncbi:hypothetical protein [Parabacteroides goldsteinii]|nr:hypothetical protein [Parabacteroides goldsteinii]